MKRQPLEEAMWQGCYNCSPTAPLDLDESWWNINGFAYMENNITIDDYIKRPFSDAIKRAKILGDKSIIEVWCMSAYHEEIYEWDHNVGKFRLVKQMSGYA